MCYEITLQAVDSVEGDVDVCHIDEFERDTIGLVAQLSGSESKSACIEPAIADRFERCDYVKHTDYYQITVDRAVD